MEARLTALEEHYARQTQALQSRVAALEERHARQTQALQCKITALEAELHHVRRHHCRMEAANITATGWEPRSDPHSGKAFVVFRLVDRDTNSTAHVRWSQVGAPHSGGGSAHGSDRAFRSAPPCHGPAGQRLNAQ